jgi:hypothetical protein
MERGNFRWSTNYLNVMTLLQNQMLQKEERGRHLKKCRNLLGNEKAENYGEIVQEPILSDSAVGCNMSLKHHSPLNFCPENVVAVSDEHSENFCQDISQMEER